jgi:hypothetical protein
LPVKRLEKLLLAPRIIPSARRSGDRPFSTSEHIISSVFDLSQFFFTEAMAYGIIGIQWKADKDQNKDYFFGEEEQDQENTTSIFEDHIHALR